MLRGPRSAPGDSSPPVVETGWAEFLAQLTGTDPARCPRCGIGRLLLVAEIPVSGRGPHRPGGPRERTVREPALMETATWCPLPKSSRLSINSCGNQDRNRAPQGRGGAPKRQFRGSQSRWWERSTGTIEREGEIKTP